MAELKNALRSGDLSVAGSRHFKDFEDYLLPAEIFGRLRCSGLSLAVASCANTPLETAKETLASAAAHTFRIDTSEEPASALDVAAARLKLPLLYHSASGALNDLRQVPIRTRACSDCSAAMAL